MRIPERKHSIIAELLERYLAAPQPWGLSDIARKHNAVPLYAGWTGTVFLRTDGQFFTLDQEDRPGEFLPEPSEHWQIASLATASRRDPSFLPLLPERTRTSVDCSICKGRGFVEMGEPKLDITCGECAGLGWCDPKRSGG